MATITQPLITKEEFEQLPDAGARYEVVDGHLVEVTPMGNVESVLAGRIITALNNFLADSSSWEVHTPESRYRLRQNPDLIRGCDVGYVPKERMPGGRPTSPVGDYVPALVVEIISRSNTAAETVRKIEEWFAAGANLVWIVYPEQKTVYVYQAPDRCQILHSDGNLDGGVVLPGFQLELQTLFA